MKQTRILATADVHFCLKYQEPALRSLDIAYEVGLREKVDLFAIAGDLFDMPVHNTASSGFPRLVRLLQKMLNIAPIVAVRGTPTHDIEGSYDALQEISAEYPFILLQPGRTYFLDSYGWVTEGDNLKPEDRQMVIFGCPEPSKEWFLAGKSAMGRDEANQAIIQGMKEIMLGLGAKRKEYPELPCLFVYHGMIREGKLSDSQKRRHPDRKREIEIGKDDLQMINADYYALGHIHLGQKLSNGAYYSGSVFPVDWRELDQKGFNLVTFERPGRVGVERCRYPHPPRKKIIQHYGQGVPDDDVEGYQVWLEIHATKEQKRILNTETVLMELEANGAVEGSRVTIKEKTTETVRAGQIREASGLPEKVRIWAENANEKISERILEKAASIEIEARQDGLAPEGLIIRLRKLILRGAKGIRKGSLLRRLLGKEPEPVDEIEIDLDQFEPGLIGIVGPNGSGKTTWVENFQPFSRMLTRPGKLQDHFYLRDSARDLYFTGRNHQDESEFRAYMQIDGQNSSGQVDYHLYRDGKPLSNGRKTEYDTAIQGLFGNLPLFLQSAFVSQDAVTIRVNGEETTCDLKKASAPMKRIIMRELGGLTYLQHEAELAHTKAKQEAEEISQDEILITNLEQVVSEIPDKSMILADEIKDLHDRKEELEELEAEVEGCREETKRLTELVQKNQEAQSQIDALEDQKATAANEKQATEVALAESRGALEGQEEAEKAIQEYEDLGEQEKQEYAERTRIQTEREKKLLEHGNAEKAVADQEREIETEKAEVKQKGAVLVQEKQGLIDRIDEIEDRLQQKIECPKCHHSFQPEGEELLKRQEEYKAKVFELDQSIESHRRRYQELKDEKASLKHPEKPELPEFDTARLDVIKLKMKMIGIDEHRATVEKAKVAAVRIEEGEKRLKEIDDKIKLLDQSIQTWKEKIDPNCESLLAAAKADEEQEEIAYQGCRERIARTETVIDSLSEQLAELERKKQELQKTRKAIKERQQELVEWKFLERACGPKGIQALEIDAMGPEIERVANQLLAVALESNIQNPFDQIRFETVRMAGKGKDKRQIEDFQIFCHDTRDDTWTDLSNISGGEEVWIKRAIYEAFAVHRSRTSGIRFLTAFQDETDGKLDAQGRQAYFRMLEAAHQESGRHHTIVITHSEAAQQMIGQRIDMAAIGKGGVA